MNLNAKTIIKTATITATAASTTFFAFFINAAFLAAFSAFIASNLFASSIASFSSFSRIAAANDCADMYLLRTTSFSLSQFTQVSDAL